MHINKPSRPQLNNLKLAEAVTYVARCVFTNKLLNVELIHTYIVYTKEFSMYEFKLEFNWLYV